ncbi:MAG: radical SAM protein [Spirochaetales bacterium]|nr:radical SAM protein [Spirochaetales bacterium]
MKLVMATIHLEESTRAVPLAAACLKAEAEPKHEVVLLDFTLDHSADEIAAGLLEVEDCQCIGFPVYLWNRQLVLDVIGLLRQSRPDLPLIAGGPDVTAAPAAFLENSGVDLVMQGEGEELITPVLDALEGGLPVPDLPGLSSRAHHSPVSAFCRDINTLQSPILSGALDLSKNRGLLWELSRGCPFACEFCFESKGSGRVRTFSSERIRAELEAIREGGIEQVFVLDPTFNVNRERVLSILEWIAELTPKTYYYFEIRTEFLDQETTEAFASVPCTLQIGLQSASPSVLKTINRKFNPREFRDKTALLGEAGVSFGLDLIYGLPGDTLQGFRDSINYALSLEPNHLDLFPLAVLPGTALYDRRKELMITAEASDPYLVQETPDFPPADLERAAALSRACDFLYNRNRGISWLSRVCYDLDLSGADLTERWLQAGWTDSEESENLKTFLKDQYNVQGKGELYPVIEDMLDYLDLLEDLEAGENSTTPEEQISLSDDTLLSLHSSCRIKTLHIHPAVVTAGFPGASEDLLTEAGEFRTLFWLRDFELCVDLLTEDEISVLNLLQKDGISYGELQRTSSLNEMNEFLISGILEAWLQIS